MEQKFQKIPNYCCYCPACFDPLEMWDSYWQPPLSQWFTTFKSLHSSKCSVFSIASQWGPQPLWSSFCQKEPSLPCGKPAAMNKCCEHSFLLVCRFTKCTWKCLPMNAIIDKGNFLFANEKFPVCFFLNCCVYLVCRWAMYSDFTYQETSIHVRKVLRILDWMLRQKSIRYRICSDIQ